jgi:ketosteroid isomerase-like protein
MSEANIALVKGLYAAFGRGGIEDIVGAMAPNVDWQSYGNPVHFPTLGAHRGPSEVRSFFGRVVETLEFSEFDPREFYADGDVVVALGHFTAKVKETGRVASAHWAHVFTIKGGKVVKFREYTDTASFAEAYTGMTLCKA